MNYKRIYKQIVNRAKNRKLEGYKERHHIKPKCLGGDNSKKNIVTLTAREHYIVHWLLYRIYPKNEGLSYSFWMMSNGNRGDKRKLKISSRAFEEAKQAIAKVMKTKSFRKGAINSKKHRKIISKTNRGNKNLLGYKYTEEQKLNQSLAKLGKPKQGKIIQQLDLDGNFIRKWNSVSEAASKVGVSISGLSCVLKGKQKTAGGYKWKY
jgi:hypothetical protein